jgi:hypothetical protein
MAAETIGDRVSAVWEAIKKFFKDLREKVKELWAKYVTAVGRLKRSAEAMRRKVSQTSGSKKEDTFNDKSMVGKVLGKDGKVNLIPRLAETVNTLNGLSVIKDMIIEVIEKADNKDSLKPLFSKISSAFGNDAAKDVDEGNALVGNKGIKFYIDDAGDKTTLDIFEAIFDNDQDDDADIDVLDKNQLESICSGVISVCNAITSNHDRKEKGDKKIEKALDKLAKDKKDKKAARDARVVREMLRANSKMSYLPEKIAISGCHVALSYVNKALRQYGK